MPGRRFVVGRAFVYLAERKSPAVIADLDDAKAGSTMDANVHLAGVSVFANVVQCFLHKAVDRSLQGLGPEGEIIQIIGDFEVRRIQTLFVQQRL